MNKDEIKVLLAKYKANSCTEKELEILESWYLEFESTDRPSLEEQKIEADLDEVWSKMPISQPGAPFRWSILAVAAIILITISVGFFFYKNSYTVGEQPQAMANDLAPGGNKAILTLANGKRITLTDVPEGRVAQQEGITIMKASDGRLVYKGSSRVLTPDSSLKYHSLETPEGGQYQIDLPDGTKVWLNAVSSIKFPASFEAQAFRRVELRGEAYFEVAKNKSQPFIVNSGIQEVVVTGTHFNINAYADEPLIKTTLMEGSVKVNGTYLKPGQQSLLSPGKLIEVLQADVEAAMAWKNGLFMFDNERLESVMKKISKWYGVEIHYTNEEVKELIFGGTVSRFDKVSKILKMMELTGDVHFKLQGKHITVSP